MQGKADHTEIHRTNHTTRGCMSPIGGGQADPLKPIIHRDEDVASAPMTRHRTAPPTNRAGFITPIRGRFPATFTGDEET